MSLKRNDLAGKTGTTNDSHDAWFVGYQPSLAAVAWPRTFIFDASNGVPPVISGNAEALRASIHDAPDGTIQFFADPDAARAATRYPRHGEAGNRNVLRSTPFWNLDTLVTKNFRLPWSETQRLQIR